MAITKQFLKSKPECKVKFALTAEEAGDAADVSVLGDFNNWDASAAVMTRQKNGNFSVTVTLPVGGSTRFRYLADGARWINDADADGFEFCSYANAENSIINLEQ